MDRFSTKTDLPIGYEDMKNVYIPGQKIYCGSKFLKSHGTRLIEDYDLNVQPEQDVDLDKMDDTSFGFVASQFESNEHVSKSRVNNVVTNNFYKSDKNSVRNVNMAEELQNSIVSTVAGQSFRVNKLIRVDAFHGRYTGSVGDVVVGRIVSVSKKRWFVEINSRKRATLLLSSVNLPDGVVRRHSQTDEREMRSSLKEGDVINAEVQEKRDDGCLLLNVRNLKYGKLGQGLLVRAPAYLVNQEKHRYYDFDCNISIIIGCNGYIWLYPTCLKTEDCFNHKSTILDPETYKSMSRMRNIIVMLASTETCIFNDIIWFMYQESRNFDQYSLMSLDKMKNFVEYCKNKYTTISDE